jgi:hypothetical protein
MYINVRPNPDPPRRRIKNGFVLTAENLGSKVTVFEINVKIRRILDV